MPQLKRKAKKASIRETQPEPEPEKSVMQTDTFYGRSKAGSQRQVHSPQASSSQDQGKDRRPTPQKLRQTTQERRVPAERRKSDDSDHPKETTSSREGSTSHERRSTSPSIVLPGESDDDVVDVDKSHVPRGRKKKGSEVERHFLFTKELEDDLIDWWRDHDILYNSNLPEFMDKAKKDRLLEAKAKAIGCTKQDIITRMHSLRTDFGRIMRVGPSGRGADGNIDPDKLHFKDKILWDRMCFLQDFIKAKGTKASTEFTEICSSEDEDVTIVGMDKSQSEGGSTGMARQVRATYTPPAKRKPKSTSKDDAQSAMDLQILDKVSQISSQLQSKKESTVPVSLKSPEEKECDTFLALIRVKLLKLPSNKREQMLEQFLTMVSDAVRQHEMQTSAVSSHVTAGTISLPGIQQSYYPQVPSQTGGNFPQTSGPYQHNPYSFQPTGAGGYHPSSMQPVMRQQIPYVPPLPHLPAQSLDTYNPSTPSMMFPPSPAVQSGATITSTITSSQTSVTTPQQTTSRLTTLTTMPPTPDAETVSSFARQLPDLPRPSSSDPGILQGPSATTSTTTNTSDEESIDLPYDFL